MSNMDVSPHRPRHDLQLHPGHDQLLPWILESRAWTMDLVGSVVGHVWRHSYGHGIPTFYECYVSHELRLTALDHLTDHRMSINYTSDMLICYPGFWT